MISPAMAPVVLKTIGYGLLVVGSALLVFAIYKLWIDRE